MQKLTLSPIFIIGPTGVGKTVIGRRLAKLLKRDFIDLDQQIEQHTNVDIQTIFDFEGEQGFRKYESKILQSIESNQTNVISTGAGCILAPKNRQHLQQTGLIIYLQATIDTLFKRLSRTKNKHRPLLKHDNPYKTLQDMLAKRSSLYQQIAEITIDVDNQSIENIINQLINCEQLKSLKN